MIGRHRTTVVGAALIAAGCASAGSPGPEAATAPATVSPSNGDGRETPLYGDLGPYGRPIVTSSDRAQAYFDEGLLFMYAFGTSIAEASFRAAQAEDPRCAACYWGEAWALAPYLNGGMPPGDERRAHAAIQKAKEHADHASEVERALIEAFDVRFEAEPVRDRRKRLDTLYAERMGEVAERFPDDLDVQTLRAEALMLLRPRRGSVDLEAPDVQRILPILEGVLARNIRHPGACHLYIHLVEASEEPERAERCAEHLGDAIAVSHIHMLLFAAVMDGQSAVAIQAARDLARQRGPWAWYVPATLARFGRWTEILEGYEEVEEPMGAAAWSWARGLARLRAGDAAGAREDLARIEEIRADADSTARFRFHDLSDVLILPRSILAAEIAHAEGRTEEAIATLEAAVEVEDGLVYDEPEPWHLPVRHVLGAILLEADRPAEAEAVYREALDHHPENGWSLFGLARSLEAQGKKAAAQEAHRRYRERWKRADIWLRSSRF